VWGVEGRPVMYDIAHQLGDDGRQMTDDDRRRRQTTTDDRRQEEVVSTQPRQ